MIRLGLCCIFRAELIRFRRKTAAWLSLEEDLTVEVEAKAKELMTPACSN